MFDEYTSSKRAYSMLIHAELRNTLWAAGLGQCKSAWLEATSESLARTLILSLQQQRWPRLCIHSYCTPSCKQQVQITFHTVPDLITQPEVI
jgi:hypothetical protein